MKKVIVLVVVDKLYAALLAYVAQGKSVNFSIQSCSGQAGMMDRIRGF